MRFALRTFLTAVTAFCIVLFLLFAAPAIVAVPALVVVSILLTVLFTAGVVYGSGNHRAFCIGALFPAGGTFAALVWVLTVWFLSAPDLDDLFEYIDRFALTISIWSVAAGALEVFAGLVVVGARAAARPSTADTSRRNDGSPNDETA